MSESEKPQDDVEQCAKDIVRDVLDFKKDLEALLNKYSMENMSNTPDFILSEYLWRCLVAFENASICREDWYDKHLRPGDRQVNHE